MLLKVFTTSPTQYDDDFIVYMPSLQEFKNQINYAIANYNSSLVLSSYDRKRVRVFDCDSIYLFTASVVPESDYIYWVTISGTVDQLEKLYSTDALSSKGFFNPQDKDVKQLKSGSIEGDTPFTLSAYRVLPKNGGEVRTHFTLDELFE